MLRSLTKSLNRGKQRDDDLDIVSLLKLSSACSHTTHLSWRCEKHGDRWLESREMPKETILGSVDRRRNQAVQPYVSLLPFECISKLQSCASMQSFFLIITVLVSRSNSCLRHLIMQEFNFSWLVSEYIVYKMKV